jgi:mannose-6-phosphate isomerase-like protein (cupin superfamily)
MSMQSEIKKHDPASEYYFDEGCYITEFSNSSRDSRVSIARARVPPGVTTCWHFLEDITERYVIMEGTGRVEVGELQPQPVGYGDVVIIPPGVHQRITNTGDSDLIFLAICSPRFQPSSYRNVEPGHNR